MVKGDSLSVLMISENKVVRSYLPKSTHRGITPSEQGDRDGDEAEQRLQRSESIHNQRNGVNGNCGDFVPQPSENARGQGDGTIG